MPRPPPQPTDLAEAAFVVSAKLKPKELGRLLRSVREASGVTQVELAKRLKIPYTNVSRLENGAQEGRLSTLNRYLRALGWEMVIGARRREGSPEE
jgi:DNA-binding XRE family transcriptional regulator